MSARKVCVTRVMASELTRVQGGIDPYGDRTLIAVECPVEYVADDITADDILCDPAITVVQS